METKNTNRKIQWLPILLIALMLSLTITSISYAQQGVLEQEGLSEHTLIHDGIERSYLLYVPENYTGDEPLPMILNFHGLGGDMTFQFVYTQFDRYAEDYPAIIVTPQGLPFERSSENTQGEGLGERLQGTRLNELLQSNGIGERLQGHGIGSRAQSDNEERSVPVWNISGQTNGNLADDVGFVQALIEHLSATHHVDSTRIYAVGRSLGGMFSFELVCQLPDTFAAAAAMSASMTPISSNRCNVDRPIPILQIHGTDDPLVPYQSVSTTLDFWIANNQTSATPTINVVSNTNTRSGTVIEHHIYAAGMNGTIVEHYKVIGGSHFISGLPQATGVEMNREILRFFSQFDLNGRVSQ